MPSNEEMTNVLLFSSTSVPDYVEVGNNIIKATDMKIFSIEQMTTAREIMACDNTTLFLIMDSKTENFLQWNTQGISTSKGKIVNLINAYNPSVISIQETFLGNEFMLKFGGHNCIASRVITTTGTTEGYPSTLNGHFLLKKSNLIPIIKQ